MKEYEKCTILKDVPVTESASCSETMYDVIKDRNLLRTKLKDVMSLVDNLPSRTWHNWSEGGGYTSSVHSDIITSFKHDVNILIKGHNL